jgi:multimeric flavodoxin WrbA
LRPESIGRTGAPITIKVVAINGSPRKKGNTQLMLDSAAKMITSAGIDVEHVSLAELDIGPCTGCERCNKKPWDCPIKDDAAKVLKVMVAADGILMGSPVYCGGVTAQMKALLDRSVIVYAAMELKDKVGGALSCGGGQHGGQELTILQIAAFFTMQDMIVANSSGGLFGAMGVGNDRGDVKKDLEGLMSARSLGKRMAELLRSR